MIKGIIASPGIAVSKVLLINEPEIKINKKPLSNEQQANSLQKIRQAIALTSAQLQNIQQHAAKTLGDEHAAIFDGNLMILEDQEFFDEIASIIQQDNSSPEYAVQQIIEMQATTIEQMDDPYLRERAVDIRDLGTRLIKNILGIEIVDLSTIQQKCVIIIKDLTPSQTAVLPLQFIEGFATDLGGRTSHTAIIARSLEIPAIVGLSDISNKVTTGQSIILDAINNQIILDPSEEEIAQAQHKIAEEKAIKSKLALLKDLPATTKCGEHTTQVAGNIGTPKDVDAVLANGATAIGLYRSEFLFMDRSSYPSEDDQFQAYKEVVEKMAGREVILRSMDIGGDKDLPYLNLPKEQNPFLGYRAIRIGFDQLEEFKQQIRAALRAAQFGNLSLMFPMVISLDEVKQLKQIVSQCIDKLQQQDPNFVSQLKLGIMIETPAAAVTADILAQHVDFFSIGTNDLTQYTLAVDRNNEMIAKLYNHFNPAVLRLVKQVIDAGHKHQIPVAICGEMAGDILATPFLLGCGLDEFSMSPISIPKVKNYIRNITFTQAKQLASQAMNLTSITEVEQLFKQFYADNYPLT